MGCRGWLAQSGERSPTNPAIQVQIRAELPLRWQKMRNLDFSNNRFRKIQKLNSCNFQLSRLGERET